MDLNEKLNYSNQDILPENFYPYVNLVEDVDTSASLQANNFRCGMEESDDAAVEETITADEKQMEFSQEVSANIKTEIPDEFDIKEEPLDFTDNVNKPEEQMRNQHAQRFRYSDGDISSVMESCMYVGNGNGLGETVNCNKNDTILNVIENHINYIESDIGSAVSPSYSAAVDMSRNYNYSFIDHNLKCENDGAIDMNKGSVFNVNNENESFSSMNNEEKCNNNSMAVTLKCEKCSFTSMNANSMLTHFKGGCKSKNRMLGLDVKNVTNYDSKWQNDGLNCLRYTEVCSFPKSPSKPNTSLMKNINKACCGHNSEVRGSEPRSATKDEKNASNIKSGRRSWKKINFKFQCSFCDFESFLKDAIESHILSHPDKSEETLKDFRAQLSKLSVKNKLFKCDRCEYLAVSRHTLRRHIYKHTGEKPFKCNVCDYGASNKHSLTIHIRSHTGEKPYKCAFCDFKAAQKPSLTAHLRTHSGERPFKCHLCSYTARYGHSLKVHIRNHTGERPFKCSHCSYSAVQKSSLKVHMKIHL